MLTVDWENSEHGPQRRKTANGRLLHACCICHTVAPWGPTWVYYASIKDEDDGVPIPKFCSSSCREAGGVDAGAVTEAMKAAAKALEYREPTLAYREMTNTEKYRSAAADQRRRRGQQGEDQ